MATAPQFDYDAIVKLSLSAKQGKVTELTLPALPFICVDGVGDPNDTAFQEAVGTLYKTIYTIKFFPKTGVTPDGYVPFKVGPLDGLWHMSKDEAFDMSNRDAWVWTVQILLPPFVTPKLLEDAKAVIAKKSPEIDLSKVEYRVFEEGFCLQTMHVGPYSAEKESIDLIDAYGAAHNLVMNGYHHEIYLGDPRRSQPENLKTILRHPVRKT